METDTTKKVNAKISDALAQAEKEKVSLEVQETKKAKTAKAGKKKVAKYGGVAGWQKEISHLRKLVTVTLELKRLKGNKATVASTKKAIRSERDRLVKGGHVIPRKLKGRMVKALS